MSDQINAVLTAKDVEGIRDRLRKVQGLSRGNLRVCEHCGQIAQALNKGQRKVERAEKKMKQLQTTKSHAIMDEEIKQEVNEAPVVDAVATEEVSEAPAAGAVSETFEDALKAHLEKLASEDEVFAAKYADPDKSLAECIKYVQGEVFHKYVGKKAGGYAVAAPTRMEMFGMAVHYYDEKKVHIRSVSGARTTVAAAPEISKEEQARMKKAAEEKMQAKFEQEAAEKIRKREEKKKAAEAERRRKAQEEAEAKRKAEGGFTLFDMLGL